ncbi:hypothetical protein [Geotalea sp. SG265]|uniref:hypothetical protein n=1 Tax=Geotalea sp. SG265 TaxID=2922867 RepID=UPI001FAFB5FD|nr:hypothetical protein [Geotalea sp. SG265]
MSRQRSGEIGRRGEQCYQRGKRYVSKPLSAASRCLIGLLFGAVLLGGCVTFRSDRDLPPLLAQDEVLRPYAKMAVVRVSRERYGTSSELRSDDYEWAYDALRQEAAKIGADAVILPEVNLETASYLLIPSANLNARGIAIRFR